ncbi:hypothetical protein HK102_014065 [Quaeritorhiza haematococci]|nr:hypothetical protein HK102_014065 [Quaeritorhiza haematococci]
MVKIGEIYCEQTFSWQMCEIVPAETSYKVGGRYLSSFETADRQRWWVSIELEENDVGVFLRISEPITTKHGAVFAALLTGGINKTSADDTWLMFTHDTPSCGWKRFIQRDQWNSFLKSSLGVKIRILYPTSAAADSTHEMYFSLVNNKKASDCSFLVEDRQIYALSSILCHRSPYFRAMLKSDFAEGNFSKDRPIELPNLKYLAVLTCIYWMYTGRQTWHFRVLGIMRDVYAAADMFGLDDPAKRALDIISSKITLDNFGDTYVFARTFQQSELASKALAFWKDNWSKTEEKKTEANKQATVIIEHMARGDNREEELWVFAKWALGHGSGGSKAE